MRILHAIHNFPPEFRGGTERYLELLAASQAGAGHEVAILAGSGRMAPEGRLDPEEHRGVPVHRLLRRPAFRSAADPHDPEADLLVDRLLARERPDVLHVHHWFGLTSDLLELAGRRGIRCVATLHDLYATCGLFFRLPAGRPCAEPESPDTCGPCLVRAGAPDETEARHAVTMRLLEFAREFRRASRILVPSASHRDAILANRTELGPRLRVVPLGSPPLPELPVRSAGDALELVHFGHLNAVKGTALLLEALDLVRATVPVRLHLHGAVLDDAVREALERHRPPAVVHHGPYDPEFLASVLAPADAAVFPSLASESYSFAVDEALRLGLPVIVSDRGAPRERIGSRGLVVPAGDAAALAAAIRDLALNPGRLASLRAGRHERLLGPEEHARAVSDVYREVLAEPPPAAEEGGGPDPILLRRLAHRNARLLEIEAHVKSLLSATCGRKEPE